MNACAELTVVACQPGPDPSIVQLTLSPPPWAPKPGQFVMLRPANFGQELTWGRPFSIYQLDSRGLQVVFQVVGRGTQRLAGLRPGDEVAAWGPLGRGFQTKGSGPFLLLAGGIGLAAFGLFATPAHALPQAQLLFGHRLPLEAYPLYQEMAQKIPCEAMRQTTPQDIAAFSQELSRRIQDLGPQGTVLCCGPTPMLRTVARLCLEHGVAGQVSLENRMGCGVGACLGCVATNASGERVQTCVHGPVFDVRALSWE
jgi:dihydroorotate dehydrogenase electron transfer subunit